MHIARSYFYTILSLLTLSGCAQRASDDNFSSSIPIAPQGATTDLENSDRIARFQRLAAASGSAAPELTLVHVGPIPVIRVVFEERVFFASGSDQPLLASQHVLQMIADNMRHDVPDVQLTVLGHTDAVGSDAYNLDLSMRRAKTVLQELALKGVRLSQMSTVAIGKNQPIAPNNTAEGRAENRRVEFLISADRQANLSAVSMRQIPVEYFSTGQPDEVSRVQASEIVTVLQPSALPIRSEAASVTETRSTSADEFQLKPESELHLQEPMPLKQIELNHPDAVSRAPLSSTVTF